MQKLKRTIFPGGGGGGKLQSQLEAQGGKQFADFREPAPMELEILMIGTRIVRCRDRGHGPPGAKIGGQLEQFRQFREPFLIDLVGLVPHQGKSKGPELQFGAIEQPSCVGQTAGLNLRMKIVQIEVDSLESER